MGSDAYPYPRLQAKSVQYLSHNQQPSQPNPTTHHRYKRTTNRSIIAQNIHRPQLRLRALHNPLRSPTLSNIRHDSNGVSASTLDLLDERLEIGFPASNAGDA